MKKILLTILSATPLFAAHTPLGERIEMLQQKVGMGQLYLEGKAQFPEPKSCTLIAKDMDRRADDVSPSHSGELRISFDGMPAGAWFLWYGEETTSEAGGFLKLHGMDTVPWGAVVVLRDAHLGLDSVELRRGMATRDRTIERSATCTNMRLPNGR